MTVAGPSERFVIEVPILTKLRKSHSAAHFESEIVSNQRYDLQTYVEEATGHPVDLETDTSSEGFERVLVTAHAMDVSRRVLTWMMGVHDFTRHDPLILSDEGVNQAASDPAARSVLKKMRSHVTSSILLDDHDPDDVVRVTTVQKVSWQPDDYDFFISYKHLLHKELAAQVARTLQARGFRCFLDVDSLPPEVVETNLFGGLKLALDASRCCVFFETVAQMQAGETISGIGIAASVHAFELRNAHNVLFVRLDPPEVYSRVGTDKATWSTRYDLADVLISKLGFEDRSASHPDPGLGPVLERVQELVEDTLGTPATVAPLAALAIVAPRQLRLGDMATQESLGDAVLRTLLKYDLETSLALEEAGVPPLTYAATTSAWPVGRWAKPIAQAVSIWPDEVVTRARERVRRVGVLDEAGLAMGLLGAASDQATFPGRALKQAVTAMPTPAEEAAEECASQVIARALDLLERAAPGPRHGWVLPDESAGEAPTPISWTGPYRLADSADVEFFVLARLDPWLLPAALLEKHGDSIHDSLLGDVAAREDLAEHAPELALTMTDPPSDWWLVDVSPTGDATVFLASGGASCDVLAAALPPRVRRLVRHARVGGLPSSDGGATPLPDRLALWDVIARTAEHLRIRDLEPAAAPTEPGTVRPTSTATSPGSLWPPGWRSTP